MIERTTVRLPTDLPDRARRRAADEGRTLTALIEDGLRLVVSEPKRPPRKRRLPRISRAVSRMLLEVDVNDDSAVQELEDVEYVERMKTLGRSSRTSMSWYRHSAAKGLTVQSVEGG